MGAQQGKRQKSGCSRVSVKKRPAVLGHPNLLHQHPRDITLTPPTYSIDTPKLLYQHPSVDQSHHRISSYLRSYEAPLPLIKQREEPMLMLIIVASITLQHIYFEPPTIPLTPPFET